MTKLTTPQPARHWAPTTKAQRLAYLVWERPDLDQTENFLNAFGLVTAERRSDALFLRPAQALPFCYVVHRGEQARFVGLALEMGDRADLEQLAQLPGASTIEALDTPGGGEVVRLRDPAGFAVEAVYGQAPYTALPVRDHLVANSGDAQPRVNAGQRPAIAAPDILRLGHVVLELANFQEVCGWYTRHFGLIPSDVQVLDDGSPLITFLRLDRGQTPSDHHTLALAQGLVDGFSHCAFEVPDLDAVGVGQRVLYDGGYRHAWGIGRHLLGSQIFDYWEDPSGFKHEHYADGDVFTSDVATGVSLAGPASLSQWGPPLPPEFIRPKPSLELLTGAIRNLIQSPDLSLRKLLAMIRLAG